MYREPVEHWLESHLIAPRRPQVYEKETQEGRHNARPLAKLGSRTGVCLLLRVFEPNPRP
jgi:hypothetical protein